MDLQKNKAAWKRCMQQEGHREIGRRGVIEEMVTDSSKVSSLFWLGSVTNDEFEKQVAHVCLHALETSFATEF